MYSASLGSKKEPVVTGANMGEESSLFRNSAHELTLAVEDEHLAIGAKNEHETCQFRHDTLLDFLFNVDTFFKIK